MTPDKTICRFFLTSIIQAMLLATCFAASGENNYVTVSCSTPGVTGVVSVDDVNFHIATKDVAMDFEANGTVAPKPGYELVSPKGGTFENLAIGSAVSYEVKAIEAGESGASGSIVLYKVDVEIDGVGEDKEETEGAYVSDKDSGDIHKSVTIRCYPATEEGAVISVSCSGKGILFDPASGNVAREKYSPKELATKTFRLYGGVISGEERDSTVSAEHTVNKCQDSARYTVAGLVSETTATYEPEPVNRSRRKLGVGEGLDIKIKPESLRAKWYVNGSFYGAGPSISYVCPGTASTPTISAALTTGNLTLSCPLHVIEPDSVEGFSASPQLPGGGMPYKDGAENIAGVWMYLFFQVKSEDVSFENIEISEGRCSSTDATGYFADSTVWPTNFLVHLPGDSFAIKQKNNVFGIDYAGNQYIPSYPDNTWTMDRILGIFLHIGCV